MSLPKPPYGSYEAFRLSELLSGLVSCKMLTAIRFGASASVYNAEVTALELNTAQNIILALFYGLLTSDLKFCNFLQGLISKVDQLKSPYLSIWLRDDFKFDTRDVYKVISNLAHLVRGQHITFPDYVLRVFVSLNSKYSILDICKTNKDLEAFYFLLSTNVPCSRSQQTDKSSVSNLISSFESNIVKGKNSMDIAQHSVFFSTSVRTSQHEELLSEGPLKTCPHLPVIGRVPNSVLEVSTPCPSCGEKSENWICLTCYAVGCSRFVNRHMLKHYESTNHPLTLRISPLSVWCYPCHRYIDNQSIQWLSGSRTVHEPPKNFILSPTNGSKLITGYSWNGQELNYSIKEQNNDSDEDISHQSRSSSISNQSQSSECNINRQEFRARNCARSRNKSRTRDLNSQEGQPLAHAISTPNISELSLKKDEMLPEAGLVRSYLTKPGTAPVPHSQIRRLVCRRDGKGGKSPLHQASKDGLLAVVKGLIHYGAPVNCRDDNGFTPAHYAARGGYIEVLEVLKQYKADLTAIGDSGETLLHLAARKNHAGTCGWLLDNGVAIDAQGFKGRTALHCAAMWGYLDTVRLLLMCKASITIKDFYHNTAYDLAVSQGHPKVANLLKNVI